MPYPYPENPNSGYYNLNKNRNRLYGWFLPKLPSDCGRWDYIHTHMGEAVDAIGGTGVIGGPGAVGTFELLMRRFC